MITYWVLGRSFADNHDRAIRFPAPPSDTRRKQLNIPIDEKTGIVWCDKCNSWHITRQSSVAHIVAQPKA